MRTSFFGGRRDRAPWIVGLAALALLGSSAPSAAQTDASDTSAQSDHERIKELEDTVNQLKKDTRQNELSLENFKPLAGWSDGFILQSQDGNYKLRIGGYTQLDGRFFVSNKDNNNGDQFLFRRVRPVLEGTVAKYFDFKVMPDFATSNFQLFDAYVDVNYFAPYTRLRVGKFKTPVGLERLESATALMLMERGQPTNLVPARDLGIDLWGDLWDSIVNYRVGIYNGTSDLTNPTSDLDNSKDFDGRLFVSPFLKTTIKPLQGFSAGIGGSYGFSGGNPTNPNLTAGYKSFAQTTIFRYNAGSPATGANTAVARGNRARINPSLYEYWGPFGLLAEYVSSQQGVLFNSKEANVDNEAWAVGLTYMLTGEAASYKLPTVAQPVNPFDGRWGAWEVVARVSRLHIDNDAFVIGAASSSNSVNTDLEFACGVNWYLNKNIKATLDYAYSTFDGGKPSNGDREPEYEIGLRLQLVI
jgi:phosphate-selective porin OprO and OprP